MFLNEHIHALLLELERAQMSNGEWVSSSALRHIPQHQRAAAQREGYIEGRGFTMGREYRLLPAGLTALADNAKSSLDEMDRLEDGYIPKATVKPKTKRSQKPVRELVRSLGLPAPETAIVPVSPPAIEIVDKKTTAYEQACVQAIDILSENIPEARDLVNVLERLNRRRDGSLD